MKQAIHFVSLGLLATLAHAGGADTLRFKATTGSRVHKRFEANHELRIDDMGAIEGDLPFRSDGTGGWISSTHKVEFVDEYKLDCEGLPLDFARAVREVSTVGKASVVFASGEVRPEASRSSSALKRQVLDFHYVEEERDWSRCYAKVDGEEDLLGRLRGEFELLALLPPGPVEPGASWSVDLERFREVLAPGGDHQLVPEGGSMFGRMIEVGVGGDFADFYAPVGGEIKATYKGRRPVTLVEGTPPLVVEAGVIELAVNFVSLADRKYLYRMAMPQTERRENAYVDDVPLEYTFLGSGELLWDIDGGRAISFKLEGNEGFISTVTKTRFDRPKPERYSQQSRFSGPLKLQITFADGSAVPNLPERVNPKADVTGRRKR
ncbi:MAG: hypothetical protein FJ298_05615 [Planctomycetes bacterium]|nr:hypothetical protein [Planctomycetota bacterium]